MRCGSIQRTEGKPEVLVDDGYYIISYNLDEALIKLELHCSIKVWKLQWTSLSPSKSPPETEANWKTLAKLALEQQNLYVAEPCYAALGNMSRAE